MAALHCPDAHLLFCHGVLSAIIPALMVIYPEAELLLYVTSFATALLDVLFLPILVRAALLAGGEVEPRLGTVWSKLWGGHTRSTFAYLAVSLVFTALPIASIEIGQTIGVGSGSLLQMGVGGLLEAIGELATIACLIAIAQSLLRVVADEAEVFS